MSTTQSNPFLLAADNPQQLTPLLRTDPSLASTQDAHGYSLIHAAVSYNHIDLLRTLVHEFNVPVDLKDEDGETALFVCETVECAKILVEELHCDTKVIGEDGKTAGEKIEAEGDFPEVAVYLLQLGDNQNSRKHNGIIADQGGHAANLMNQAPSLPEGVTINMGTMSPEDAGGEVVDLEFKKRIEELAARNDFQGEEGQRQLRELIMEAVRGTVGEERDVRRRIS
jgi:uncharacterized protein